MSIFSRLNYLLTVRKGDRPGDKGSAQETKDLSGEGIDSRGRDVRAVASADGGGTEIKIRRAKTGNPPLKTPVAPAREARLKSAGLAPADPEQRQGVLSRVKDRDLRMDLEGA